MATQKAPKNLLKKKSVEQLTLFLFQGKENDQGEESCLKKLLVSELENLKVIITLPALLD